MAPVPSLGSHPGYSTGAILILASLGCPGGLQLVPPSERRLGVITGTRPNGGNDPVGTSLLRRATDVARLVGAVLQAVYYGLKLW